MPGRITLKFYLQASVSLGFSAMGADKIILQVTYLVLTSYFQLF